MGNRGAANRYYRAQNTPEVIQFCNDNGFAHRWVNGDWHLRIEDVIDVYPGRKRFFFLPTKEWGWYQDYEDLGRILVERLPK
jgi:hypothetical protein